MAESRPQRGILDPQLIDQRTTLLPSTIGLVRGLQGGIEQLRPRFQVSDVGIPAFSEGALGLSVLFRTFAVAQRSPPAATPATTTATATCAWRSGASLLFELLRVGVGRCLTRNDLRHSARGIVNCGVWERGHHSMGRVHHRVRAADDMGNGLGWQGLRRRRRGWLLMLLAGRRWGLALPGGPGCWVDDGRGGRLLLVVMMNCIL